MGESTRMEDIGYWKLAPRRSDPRDMNLTPFKIDSKEEERGEGGEESGERARENDKAN